MNKGQIHNRVSAAQKDRKPGGTDMAAVRKKPRRHCQFCTALITSKNKAHKCRTCTAGSCAFCCQVNCPFCGERP